MAAASALTALGDEDSQGADPNGDCRSGDGGGVSKESTDLKEEKNAAKEQQKRYLPQHKKPDAALTFPEKVGTSLRLLLSVKTVTIHNR